MPYIAPSEREYFDKAIDDLIAQLLIRSGETTRDGILNYTITRILHALYMPRYYSYNSAIGMLECVKQEFYRRSVALYEDSKMKENGDVR